jgi:hypothetical protein
MEKVIDQSEVDKVLSYFVNSNTSIIKEDSFDFNSSDSFQHALDVLQDNGFSIHRISAGVYYVQPTIV